MLVSTVILVCISFSQPILWDVYHYYKKKFGGSKLVRRLRHDASSKRSFSKTVFAFQCGQKTFWKLCRHDNHGLPRASFSQTQIPNHWWLFKDVHAYCFCPSFYCARKFTCHVMHERVWNKQMIGQMAIARALPGFNDLGRSVTPIFLSMDHFLYWFSTFREKMKKIYRLEVWIFGKMHHRILFLLALHASVWQFQMPLQGLILWKYWQHLEILM